MSAAPSPRLRPAPALAGLFLFTVLMSTTLTQARRQIDGSTRSGGDSVAEQQVVVEEHAHDAPDEEHAPDARSLLSVRELDSDMAGSEAQKFKFGLFKGPKMKFFGFKGMKLFKMKMKYGHHRGYWGRPRYGYGFGRGYGGYYGGHYYRKHKKHKKHHNVYHHNPYVSPYGRQGYGVHVQPAPYGHGYAPMNGHVPQYHYHGYQNYAPLIPFWAAGSLAQQQGDAQSEQSNETQQQAVGNDPLADFLGNVGASSGNTQRDPDSPFGNPMVNDGTAFPTADAKKKAVDIENTLLLGEITEHIAEEREEEKIEEVCIHNNRREQTSYEDEQMTTRKGFKDVSADFPLSQNGITAAHTPHHQCDPVWKTHRGLLATMFRPLGTGYNSYGNKVGLPSFPARLGELVIEEVRHREEKSGEHVVLMFKGCSSCENDLTQSVEWGGLTPVNEVGAYQVTPQKDQIVQVRNSYGCLQSGGCSQDENYNTWTHASNLYGQEGLRPKRVSRAFYVFSSYQGDVRIEPLLNVVNTPGLDPTKKAQALDLLTNELHAEEKHVPFNHKLEQLRIMLSVCRDVDAGNGQKKLQCEDPEEELLIHDGAIMSGSTTKTLLETVGEYETCQVGPCGQGTSMTSCITPCQTPASFQGSRASNNQDLCYAGKVPLSEANPDQWKDGYFSCIEEITIDGAVKTDTPIVHRLGSSGLFFRTGTDSKAHVEGAINWHVTVPTKNQCLPELGDALYIGMGVDEADACAPNGPDLDLGIIMYACKADGLAGLHNCPIVDAITFKHPQKSSAWWSRDGQGGAATRSQVPQWGMYSGDNLGGEGEGDDEWFFLRLDAMKAMGVTHVAINAFLYGCEGNSRRSVTFSQLEGAFMRFASGPADQNKFPASETIAYYDLDVGMAKASGKGALMAVLFLEKEADHKLKMPESASTRTDLASKYGEHWQLAFLAEPLSARSLFDGYQEVTNKLFKVGDLPESQEASFADDLTKMGTGLKGDVPLAPMFDQLADKEITKIESSGKPGETNEEKGARMMNAAQFWRDFTTTLPGGHPGRALFCAA